MPTILYRHIKDIVSEHLTDGELGMIHIAGMHTYYFDENNSVYMMLVKWWQKDLHETCMSCMQKVTQTEWDEIERFYAERKDKRDIHEYW